MTDFGNEWTNEECAQFVRDNVDDLSGFVKLLRGEAVLKNDNGQTFIIPTMTSRKSGGCED